VNDSSCGKIRWELEELGEPEAGNESARKQRGQKRCWPLTED
jgi:hypothetical protein